VPWQRRRPPVWHPKVVIGEHQTFMGEEALLRSRGVQVARSAECIELMKAFIAAKPAL
jgi:cytosine/creatinine deaminase